MHVIHCAGRSALTDAEASAVGAAVRAGGVVLFPTDTLYGLGADPFSGPGVAAVFRLKGREPGKPLPVLLADASLIGRFARGIPPAWRVLIRQYWPGPLTLLFPALPGLPEGIRSASGKVALRVPASPLCRSVLAAAGGSLTGTSANRAGAGGEFDVGAAVRGLHGEPDLLVDAGTLPASRESTLLDTDASGAVTVIRRGVIAAAAIEAALAGAGAVDPAG